MLSAAALSHRNLEAEVRTIEGLKATIALLKRQSRTAVAELDDEVRRHRQAEERARESIGDKAEVLLVGLIAVYLSADV